MTILPVWGLPGIRAIQTATPKIIFKGGYIPVDLPQGKIIHGATSRDPSNTPDVGTLRPGLLMGKRTADSFYSPSILGVANGAVAAAASSITVAAAVVTELVRRVGSSGTFKLTGPPTAAGVVQTETVTYSAASGTTITVTATSNAYVTGSFLQPTDGSETPLTLIPDGTGIHVVDTDGVTSLDVPFPEMPIGGLLIASAIINWPSDTSLQRWIANRLNDVPGGKFTFDTVY